MMKIVITLALVLATVNCTKVQQCKGLPVPLDVRIKDCDEPPCVVYRGSIAVMEVHFLGNNNNINSITATTTAKVLGMNQPYDLPDEVSDVCRNLMYGAICPIDKDEDVTYQFNFYVETWFPEITADVTVKLNDAQNEPITCFVVSCKIRKGATASQRDEYLLDWTNPGAI
ncbi:uncharacterized protein LOC108026922 [Drosophila biarmipes]|uniref:uncharacterized protein LOC108026922 n=1 Tax=Drosophila biarmipes TaxID=125945 RepID=UPI0007E7548E|nr:uncharacterized protein LOC108026922 [Drosophila biarmipes]